MQASFAFSDERNTRTTFNCVRDESSKDRSIPHSGLLGSLPAIGMRQNEEDFFLKRFPKQSSMCVGDVLLRTLVQISHIVRKNLNDRLVRRKRWNLLAIGHRSRCLGTQVQLEPVMQAPILNVKL